MEAVFSQRILREWTVVAVAAVFLGLSALVRVPCGVVPFTLQTLALFSIALHLSPRMALLSVLAYLGMHTSVHPLWMIGPKAGYLIGFPIAAYVVSSIKETRSPLLAVFVGQMIVYACGFSWLSSFIGMSNAWVYGVLVFMAPDLCKALAAVYAKKNLKHDSF